MAVADAVVAGEIARGLGGRDHVVGRDSDVGEGKIDLDDRRAERAVGLDRGLDRGVHRRVVVGAEILLGQTDAQARDRRLERADEVLDRRIRARRIARVETRDRLIGPIFTLTIKGNI